MRPIIRRSKLLSERDHTNLILTKPSKAYLASTTEGEGRKREREREEEKGLARRHARIPEGLMASFSVSPALEPRERGEGGGTTGIGGTNGGTKFREYKKKLIAGQFISFSFSFSFSFPFLFLGFDFDGEVDTNPD